jgi:hypothetical protein
MNREPAHSISKRGSLGEGRPTKRTPEVVAKIASGLTHREAGIVAGIRHDTMTEWRKDPEFSEAIEKATAERLLFLRLERIEAGETGWQGTAWALKVSELTPWWRNPVNIDTGSTLGSCWLEANTTGTRQPAQSGNRNVCRLIDELKAQKCRAKFFARKAAFYAPVACRKPRTLKTITDTSLRKTSDYENAMEGPKHLAEGWQIGAQKLRPVQKWVLGKNAVGPVLFDHLPSAFGIPQEAYRVPHSTYEAEDRNMSRFRVGTGLPDQ